MTSNEKSSKKYPLESKSKSIQVRNLGQKDVTVMMKLIIRQLYTHNPHKKKKFDRKTFNSLLIRPVNLQA